MYFPNDDTQNYPFFSLKLVNKLLNAEINEQIKNPQSC